MLLIDRLVGLHWAIAHGRLDEIEGHGLSPAQAATLAPRSRGFLDAAQSAQRFVIDLKGREMIRTLTDQPGRLIASAPYFFAPAERTWIEIEYAGGGRRIGIMATCRSDSLTAGTGILYAPMPPGSPAPAAFGDQPIACPFAWDLHAAPSNLISWSAELGRDETMRMLARVAGSDVSVDLDGIGLTMLGCLAVLCQPRIHERRHVDRQKLNRRRAARGKYPLLAYHQIIIDAGGEEPSHEAGAGAGAERALHFVRAHLRICHHGKIALVRPHWRGNPELGIRRAIYRVTRSE